MLWLVRLPLELLHKSNCSKFFDVNIVFLSWNRFIIAVVVQLTTSTKLDLRNGHGSYIAWWAIAVSFLSKSRLCYPRGQAQNWGGDSLIWFGGDDGFLVWFGGSGGAKNLPLCQSQHNVLLVRTKRTQQLKIICKEKERVNYLYIKGYLRLDEGVSLLPSTSCSKMHNCTICKQICSQ